MNTATAIPVSKRLRYLDAAKGWGLCMVVFGHITSLGNPVDTWFGSYKLAIFWVISGYLLCMRQTLFKYSFKEYFIKQLQTLIIPYLGYSAFVIAYNILLGFMRGSTPSQIFHKFLELVYTTFSFRGISALWFLPSIFIGQMLIMLIIKCPKWVKVPAAVIPLIISHYVSMLIPYLEKNLGSVMNKVVSFPILTVSKGLLAFWFVGAGYLSYLILKRVTGRYIRFLLGLVLFIANIYLSQLNPGVNLNHMGLGVHPVLMYTGGIIGSLGTMLILEFLEKWWRMDFLTFCGKYSLVIMATHGTLGFKALLVRGWQSFYKLSGEPGLRYYLECTGILMELMLLECGVIRIVENYFPWLMGKFKKKS